MNKAAGRWDRLAQLRRMLRCRDGNAALELALAAPVLVMLLVGTADFGIAAYRNMQVQHAAQAGIDYAMRNGFNSGAITTAVANATPMAGIAAEPAPVQSCGCAAGTTITAAICNTTCAAGGLAGVYVTVSAQMTHAPLLAYPGIPPSFTFAATSTARIQ